MYITHRTEVINTRIEELKCILASLDRSLSHAPEGSVNLAHCKNTIQYYFNPGNGEKPRYLSDKRKADALMQKDYDRKTRNSVIAELKAYEAIAKKFPKNIYANGWRET